jgi:ribose 1,5-bisphosphokinase PhnN
MIGALAGDFVGSIYEWQNNKTYYGIPQEIERQVYTMLDAPKSDVTRRFTNR